MSERPELKITIPARVVHGVLSWAVALAALWERAHRNGRTVAAEALENLRRYQ